MSKPQISAVVLAKNAEAIIDRTLRSSVPFAEVVLVDNGSTDRTCELAKKYPNVKIVSHPGFPGFVPLRNFGAGEAAHDWIFVLDSDEELSPELGRAMETFVPERGKAYRFPFKNFFQGQWIRGCGWYPDRQVCLYHRKDHAFQPRKVHESLDVQEKDIVDIPLHMHHYSYTSVDDFLRKMQLYSTLFAEEKGKKGSFWKALLHGSYAFFRSYILKGGIRDGKNGYIISKYNQHVAYYKYLKLVERDGP
ncbi:MAG: hypothetical protein A3F09_01395 [Chlamydiae bacterium RIFCSPHIGHO2_12_FULL_49_11]|nr:MAG: hypothetical protein A3F09_01395 [Chlamydiae bacterium RIFCSPHIGHO2_12_FULL_49_11]